MHSKGTILLLDSNRVCMSKQQEIYNINRETQRKPLPSHSSSAQITLSLVYTTFYTYALCICIAYIIRNQVFLVFDQKKSQTRIF